MRTRRSTSSNQPTSDAGVVFPLIAGTRSSLATGQRIIAAGTARIDTATHEAARYETRWRTRYIPHIRELTRLAAHQHGPLIAVDGLNAVHSLMQHRRHGAEMPVAEALASPRPDFLHTYVVEGTGEAPSRQLAVPIDGQVLSGPELIQQLEDWMAAGVAEPSFSVAIQAAISRPDWFDLRDTTVAVFGASSEMGPYRSLLSWGCRVIAVDLPEPDRWVKLIAYARSSPGTLILPTRRQVPPDVDDFTIARLAGADVITEAPEITAWMTTHTEPYVLGDYVYAVGSTHLRCSAAVDAIIDYLLARRRDIGLAYLATPTDAYIVPDTVAEFSRRRYEEAGTWVNAVRGMSGKRLYRPNYGVISSTANGQRFAVADALVPQQGANYAVAKRIQRWRAQRARDRGTFVSINVGPATSTASVLRNRLLAHAYGGAYRFGLHIFEPETSQTLMAALLVHDMRSQSSIAHPQVPLEEPYLLFVDQALHGGMWRGPYAPRSVLGAAVLAGMVPRH